VQNYVKVNPNTLRRVFILGVGVPQRHKYLEQGLGDQTLSKLGEESGDSSQVWIVVHLMKFECGLHARFQAPFWLQFVLTILKINKLKIEFILSLTY
jgi:hypothetical protein